MDSDGSFRYPPSGTRALEDLGPLLSRFRVRTGAEITDEALSTFLLKAHGDIEEAARRYQRSFWTLQAQSKDQESGLPTSCEPAPSYSSGHETHSSFPSHSGGSEHSECAGVDAKTTQSGPGLAEVAVSHRSKLQSSGSRLLSTSVSNGPFSFPLKAPEPADTIHLLGDCTVDVVSSCRFPNGSGDQYSALAPRLPLAVEFHVSPLASARRLAKRLKTGHLSMAKRSTESTIIAATASSAAVGSPAVAGTLHTKHPLTRIADGVTGKVWLGGTGQYVGTLVSAVASKLAPLVYCGFIRVEARLSESLPHPISIGYPIPVNFRIYLQSSVWEANFDWTPEVQALMRECWIFLFFTLLSLRPAQASLFWAFNSSDAGTGECKDVTSGDAAPRYVETPDTVLSVEKGEENSHEGPAFECLTDQDADTMFDASPIHSDTEMTARNEEVFGSGEEGDDTFFSQDFLSCSRESEQNSQEENGNGLSTYCSRYAPPLDPHIFRSELRPYQAIGVEWMRRSERHGDETQWFSSSTKENPATADNRQQTLSTRSPRTQSLSPRPVSPGAILSSTMLHPMWDQFILPARDQNMGGKAEDTPKLVFYFSRTTGELTKTFPVNVPQCFGGILADSMGLGKTVQTIALLACELSPTAREKEAIQAVTSVDDSINSDPIMSDTFTRQLVTLRQRTSAIQRHIDLWTAISTPCYPATEPLPSLETTPGFTAPTRLLAGTLLILPLSLLPQWKNELLTHITPGAIRIAEYYGPGRNTRMDPLKLTQADVVLTTYGTVSSEYTSNGQRCVQGASGCSGDLHSYPQPSTALFK